MPAVMPGGVVGDDPAEGAGDGAGRVGAQHPAVPGEGGVGPHDGGAGPDAGAPRPRPAPRRPPSGGGRRRGCPRPAPGRSARCPAARKTTSRPLPWAYERTAEMSSMSSATTTTCGTNRYGLASEAYRTRSETFHSTFSGAEQPAQLAAQRLGRAAGERVRDPVRRRHMSGARAGPQRAGSGVEQRHVLSWARAADGCAAHARRRSRVRFRPIFASTGQGLPRSLE